MKRNQYVIGCLLFFVIGAYLWKIKADGLEKIVYHAADAKKDNAEDERKENQVLFEIGKEVVTKADIEWEYQLIVRELENASVRRDGSLAFSLSQPESISIKKKLASSLIERKVLYAAIQRDESFNMADPNRYISCLTQWKEVVDREHIVNQNDRNRLKNRLCERSVLEQYMTERLFKDLRIEDSDVGKYYEANKSQLRHFESVNIKHILFVDEPTAKRWRSALTVQNFSEMAKIHSITPEGKIGGRLGPFMKGMLPAVFDIAFNMKVGEISDILRSNYGYHVILLEEKNQKRTLDLDSARAEIIRILQKKKRETIYDAWLEQALASVRVSGPKTNI